MSNILNGKEVTWLLSFRKTNPHKPFLRSLIGPGPLFARVPSGGRGLQRLILNLGLGAAVTRLLTCPTWDVTGTVPVAHLTPRPPSTLRRPASVPGPSLFFLPSVSCTTHPGLKDVNEIRVLGQEGCSSDSGIKGQCRYRYNLLHIGFSKVAKIKKNLKK